MAAEPVLNTNSPTHIEHRRSASRSPECWPWMDDVGKEMRVLSRSRSLEEPSEQQDPQKAQNQPKPEQTAPHATTCPAH